MGKYFPSALIPILWQRMKDYVQEKAYIKRETPTFYIDADTMTLYISKTPGYDFYLDPTDGTLYYKERGV